MIKNSRSLLGLALFFPLAFGVAGAAAETVKIGILTDISGMHADMGGMGSIAAAQMAIDEFGGKAGGMEIEMISADMQSKPDIATSIARKWYENDGVDMIADINNSTAAIAINHLAQDLKKINLVSQAGSSRLQTTDCTPYSAHWGTQDLYMLSVATTKALLEKNKKKWFLIAVDYTFGHEMQANMTKIIEEAGGKVVGVLRHSHNTADFSSYLLQAQASDAEVVALINSGQDFKTSLKQAREFGLVESGKSLAAMVVVLSDIKGLGIEATQGLVWTEMFYWDRNEETRKWSQAFFERTGFMPTSVHGSVYSSVRHYLKAVDAIRSKQSDLVMAQMKKMPVVDMYAVNGVLRDDGLMAAPVYLLGTRPRERVTGEWDLIDVLATTPPEQAFRPIENCQYAQAR